jgi:hypothetical protein
MKRREIARVQAAASILGESAIMLKVMLPVFISGAHPDWPIVTDDIRRLHDQLAARTALRLVEHALPGDEVVMVSIEGADTAELGFFDRDGEEPVWRFQDGTRLDGKVYAWSDAPASLNARRTARHLLTFPTGGAS